MQMPLKWFKIKAVDEDIDRRPPRFIEDMEEEEEEIPDFPEDPFGAVMLNVSGASLPEGTEPSGSLSAFGWTVFDTVGEENVVFSPYGIYMAVGMLANGAEPGSDTEAELLNATGSSSRDSLNAYMAVLLKAVGEHWRSRFCSDSLVLVNSSMVFGGDVNEDYRNRVARYCRGAVVEEDISGNLSGVRKKITDWVNLKSFGMIPEYESQIEKDTLCDLLNVVYFKGAWESKFSKRCTEDEEFKNADGSVSKVKMMHKTVPDIHFYSDGKYKAISLLYRDADQRMCLILPDDGESLDVLSSWKSETLEYREKFIGRLRSSRIVRAELSLPKFTMSAAFSLDDVFRALGLKNALGGNSRFTGVIDGSNLFFGSGTHQAKIKVDENGTEAAAVTEVAMVGCAGPRKEPEKVVFRCDIPFLYVLLDGEDDKYLFMGYAGDGRDFA